MLGAFSALRLFAAAGLMDGVNVLGPGFPDGGLDIPFGKSVTHTDVHFRVSLKAVVICPYVFY